MPEAANPPDIASMSVADTLATLQPFLKFLKKFWGISAWMLELIIVLSAVLGKYSDLVVGPHSTTSEFR